MPTEVHVFCAWDPRKSSAKVDKYSELTIFVGRTAMYAVPAWTIKAAGEVVWVRLGFLCQGTVYVFYARPHPS